MVMFESSQELAVTHRARAVVYDRKSGRIVHVHEILTLADAPRPSEGAVVSRAMELAKTLVVGMKGVAVSRLLAVETDAETEIDAATHRIDPKTGRLKPLRGKSRR